MWYCAPSRYAGQQHAAASIRERPHTCARQAASVPPTPLHCARHSAAAAGTAAAGGSPCSPMYRRCQLTQACCKHCSAHRRAPAATGWSLRSIEEVAASPPSFTASRPRRWEPGPARAPLLLPLLLSSPKGSLAAAQAACRRGVQS